MLGKGDKIVCIWDSNTGLEINKIYTVDSYYISSNTVRLEESVFGWHHFTYNDFIPLFELRTQKIEKIKNGYR